MAKKPIRRVGLRLPKGTARSFPISAARNVGATVADRMNAVTRKGVGGRTASTQMAMEKIRTPLDKFTSSQIPYDIYDKEERAKIRDLCNTPDAPVWMADYSFKPMGEIQPGDKVLGWTTNKGSAGNARQLRPTTVLAVRRRMAPEIVEITMESGRTIRCTPDHKWAKGTLPPLNSNRDEYREAYVGMKLYHVAAQPQPLTSDKEFYAAGYIAAMIDGEGNWNRSTIVINQSLDYNPEICATIEENLNVLGIQYKIKDRTQKSNLASNGTTLRQFIIMGSSTRTRQQLINLYNICHPTKMTQQRMDAALLTSAFGNVDKVVSIKSIGSGEVVSMQTETGNYIAWGFASKNCRIYYMTHNLVPLAIDVYTRFPIQGIEIISKDPDIKKFYEQLFFDQLNYKQFLIDIGREFFTVGEVNILATFNELLGIWESEEIVNPDDLTVTRTPFSNEERIHMAIPENIKEIIEKREPKDEYQILVSEYPEIVKAARDSQQSTTDSPLGEGLEISNVLLSRIVNKSAPWDVYGTPHLMRAFTLLNLEEALYAAQKAIADRLYSPLILAKLGSPDLGDGEAWVPDPEALEAFNDMMAQAMAADFRFITYHYGIEIESVFGRESVPRFDQDFDRIESKMLEIWGIGESLIQGGSGGPYASSALNSEFVTQMMTSYQQNIQDHFKKRVEVVAEAQGHFDYDLVDGEKVTIMEEYIEIDDDGEEHVRKRPKLLLPELKFAVMNIRDEASEREFLMGLKQIGVPVSDEILMTSADMDFDEQIEKIAEEKVQKVIAQQEMLVKLQKALTERNLPIPPEMAAMPTAPTSLPIQQDITSPVNVPSLTMDPNAMQIAQQNAQSLQGQAPASPGAAPGTPPSPVSSTPAPAAPSLTQNTTLPSNWISQRPAISDNMRAGMPSMAKKSRRRPPSVIGMRNNVTKEEADQVVNERPWTKTLKG